jgi:hypothetical protein
MGLDVEHDRLPQEERGAQGPSLIFFATALLPRSLLG